MSQTLKMKQGDRLPSFTATLYQAVNDIPTPIDLTGATVVFHLMLDGANTLKVNAAAVVVDAPSGTVRYDWAASDTNTAGSGLWEIEVTYTASGKQLTVPDGLPGYPALISPQLG